MTRRGQTMNYNTMHNKKRGNRSERAILEEESYLVSICSSGQPGPSTRHAQRIVSQTKKDLAAFFPTKLERRR